MHPTNEMTENSKLEIVGEEASKTTENEKNKGVEIAEVRTSLPRKRSLSKDPIPESALVVKPANKTCLKSSRSSDIPLKKKAKTSITFIQEQPQENREESNSSSKLELRAAERHILSRVDEMKNTLEELKNALVEETKRSNQIFETMLINQQQMAASMGNFIRDVHSMLVPRIPLYPLPHPPPPQNAPPVQYASQHPPPNFLFYQPPHVPQQLPPQPTQQSPQQPSQPSPQQPVQQPQQKQLPQPAQQQSVQTPPPPPPPSQKSPSQQPVPKTEEETTQQSQQESSQQPSSETQLVQKSPRALQPRPLQPHPPQPQPPQPKQQQTRPQQTKEKEIEKYQTKFRAY